MQMREAIGYLAALASRSDLDAIARKLLGIHLDLGAEIAALSETRQAGKSANCGSKRIRH